ncbi:MAG: hypothetical protein AAGA70_01655 [Pseudomonadota bacterium]
MDKPKAKTTLRDSDIATRIHPARRRVLGLMTLGGAAAIAGGPGFAQQESDSDNGTWTDAGSCPRGEGGEYTGVTDSDTGSLTDSGGYGRGEPYC